MSGTNAPSRGLAIVSLVSIVLGLTYVVPSRTTPAAHAAVGANATLSLSLNGPDAIPSVVENNQVAPFTAGSATPFPVSVIANTDGVSIHEVGFQMTWDPLDFRMVQSDGTALSGTQVPNAAPYRGGTNVMFQGLSTTPSINAVNNTIGKFDYVIGSNFADTDGQIYTSTTTGGPDRVVTVYFLPLRATNPGATPNIRFQQTPTDINDLMITMGVSWDAKAPIVIDSSIGAGDPGSSTDIVANGDRRLTTDADGAAGSLVDCVTAPADALCGLTMNAARVSGASVSGANATYDAGDAVYISKTYPNTQVSVGDVRIVVTGTHCSSGTAVCAVGSVAVASDTDVSTPTALTHLNGVRYVGLNDLSQDILNPDTTSNTIGARVFVSGPTVSSTTSTVTAAPTCVVAPAGTTTVAVAVRDGTSTPISSATVNLAAAPSTGVAIATNPQTSNATGVATFTVNAANAVGNVVFTATANAGAGAVTITQTATVNFASSCTSTYTISGTITGTTSVVAVGISPSGSTTSAGGATNTYAASGLAPNTYTITPTLTGCTFSPGSRAVTISTASIAGQDFAATCTTPTYSIAGTITGTTGAAALALSGAGNSSTTSAGGASNTYSFAGLANGTYIVTPTLAGCTFSPGSRAATISGANITGQDFMATCAVSTYAVTGAVTGTTSVVAMALSGPSLWTTSTPGGAGNTFTFTGIPNGSYTLTPTLNGCIFTPSSRTLTVANSNVAGQDFVATCGTTYTISGTITGTTSVVSLALTGAASGSTTSAGGASNTYSFTGAANGAYVVTPTLAGCTFSPATRTPTVSSANVAGQDFVATCGTTISPTLSSVVAGTPACSGGVSTASVVITVRDTSNAVVSGASVTIASTGTGVTVSPSSPQTSNASGQVTYTLSSATAQTVVLTVTANTGSGAVTITNYTPSSSLTFGTCTSTNVISLNPACFVLSSAGGLSSASTVLQLRTSGGSAVASTAVSSINISGSPTITPSPTSGVTNGSGDLSLALTGTGLSAGTRTLYATVSSTVLSTTLRTVPQGASCSSSSWVLSNSTKVAADAEKIYAPGASVDFTITARNSSGTSLTDVSVLDTKDLGWDSFSTGSVTITPSSGTNNSTSSQISISGMSVAANGSTAITYTQRLKTSSNLADDVGVAADADPAVDAEWWSSQALGGYVAGSGGTVSLSSATGPLDGRFVSLGGSANPVTAATLSKTGLEASGSSYVLLGFGSRVIPNTFGDDLIVITGSIAGDPNVQAKRYAVYVSPDGNYFYRVGGDVVGSAAFDLSSGGVQWATQVAIVDQTPRAFATGTSPGTGIDAVGLIHLGARVRNTATLSSTTANSTASPSATITVDLTSVMTNPMVPSDFITPGCPDVGAFTVSLPTSVHVAGGTQVALPLTVSQGRGIRSFALSIPFDPVRVDYVGVQPSPVTSGFSYVDGIISADGGRKELILGGTSSTAISACGAAVLANVVFRAKAAASGTMQLPLLNLTDDISLATVSAGSLVFTPANIPTGSTITPTCIANDNAINTHLLTVNGTAGTVSGALVSLAVSGPGVSLDVYPPSPFGPTDASGQVAFLTRVPTSSMLGDLTVWVTVLPPVGPAVELPGNVVRVAATCAAPPPTCTSFTYSTWGTCTNGTQNRSVVSAEPSGCTGGSPVLSQACTAPGPAGDVTVAITDPEGGDDFRTDSSSVTLEGTMGPGVATVEVDGEVATTDSGAGTWKRRVKLDEGDTTLTAKAYNSTRTVTASASITITLDTEAPGDVENLEGTPAGGSSRLTWDAPSDDDVETYHVYRVVGSSGVELLSTRRTEATVPGFGPFAVTAEDDLGNESDLDGAPQVRVGRDSGFADVPASHGASAAIAFLRDKGIVSGLGSGFFNPDGLVTRAEFAKMLAGVRGVSPESGETSFRDVSPRHSLAGYIAAVASRGWATGQGGYYGPGRPVTRLEAARMIVRAAGLSPAAEAADFTDVGDADARGVVGALVQAGIAAGQDGRFFPDRYLTRGEAASMLAVLLSS